MTNPKQQTNTPAAPAAPAVPALVSVSNVADMIGRIAASVTQGKGDASASAMTAAILSVASLVESKSRGNQQIAEALAAVRAAVSNAPAPTNPKA